MSLIGLYTQLACIWEASAQKPGNVHRFRDFEDAAYLDFLQSAATIAPIFDQASQRTVGEIILDGVRATRKVASHNTNLGILLLLAPLARVPLVEDLREGVERVLADLTVADSRAVYEAIRLARPGGLGRVPDQDVALEPTLSLRDIMILAQDRDMIARQYANGFREVFEEGLPPLRQFLDRGLEQAIIFTHLHLLSQYPDTLIERKRGPEEAKEASRRARQVLEAGWPDAAPGINALADLDAWLRDPGHGRNPGTTADLVAASLFAALRAGIITLPCSWSGV